MTPVTASGVAIVLLACGLVLFLLAHRLQARDAKRPRVPMEQARPEVLSIATRGSDRDRIRAIKVLRERTGVGLREASDTVKRWLQEEDRAGQ